VFQKVQQVAVAADEILGQSVNRSGKIDVVGGIGCDDRPGHLTFNDDRDGLKAVDPEIELRALQLHVSSNPGMAKAAPELFHGGRRNHEVESGVPEKANQDLSRRPFRPNERADDDVRVEDRAH